MRRYLPAVLAIALGVSVFATAAPATAGGSWFDTDRTHYEPGDEVTVVGYTGGGQYGGVGDGPFFAWLTGNSGWTDEVTAVDPEFIHFLGPMTIHENSEGYPRYRLSITFTLPGDLVEGIYGFNYCNAACDEQIGDLIGGTIYVGVDTDGGRDPRWAAWEPLLTGEPLPEHVTLVGERPDPGFVPPPPEGIWWAGTLDSPEPTTTTMRPTATTTAPTTTSTTKPEPPPTTSAAPLDSTDESSNFPEGSGVVLGGLVVGGVALAGFRIARRSDAD